MADSPELTTIRLWLELLDYASEREVPDTDYMFLADRFTAWVGRIGETRHTLGQHDQIRAMYRDKDRRRT